MSEITPLVKQISDKIDRLSSRLDATQAEKATLEKMIGELSSKLEQSQLQIERLTEENGKLKVASSISGSSGHGKEVKLKINELVREIDKCIALLNG